MTQHLCTEIGVLPNRHQHSTVLACVSVNHVSAVGGSGDDEVTVSATHPTSVRFHAVTKRTQFASVSEQSRDICVYVYVRGWVMYNCELHQRSKFHMRWDEMRRDERRRDHGMNIFPPHYFSPPHAASHWPFEHGRMRVLAKDERATTISCEVE